MSCSNGHVWHEGPRRHVGEGLNRRVEVNKACKFCNEISIFWVPDPVPHLVIERELKGE
jgi:hypothetical protein